MDFKNLKNLLDDFVNDGYAPGNTIAVYKDGKNVFNYASGYSDAINKIPMTGDEHFFLWSCSKPVTVVAAMQLLEKGKFLLSDPLYKYLPEFSVVGSIYAPIDTPNERIALINAAETLPQQEAKNVNIKSPFK